MGLLSWLFGDDDDKIYYYPAVDRNGRAIQVRNTEFEAFSRKLDREYEWARVMDNDRYYT